VKGHVHARTLKNGERRFDAVYSAPDGKQVWTTFRKEGDANRFLRDQLGKIDRREWVAAKAVTMKVVFDAWLATQDTRVKVGKLRAPTGALYAQSIGRHLRPSFDPILTTALTPEHVAKWSQMMAGKIADGHLANRTFNNIVVLFRAVMKWASHPKRGYRLDPIVMMDVQRAANTPKTKPVFAELDEVGRLITAAGAFPPFETMLATMALAGLRPGELAGLRRCDLRLDTGVLHVEQQVQEGGAIGPPKTPKGSRKIDLFLRPSGRPWDGDAIRKRFRLVLKAAGVRRMTPKALRHAWLTTMYTLPGVTPAYVADMAGRADPSIGLKVYAHTPKRTSADAMAKYAAKLDDAHLN
jgi:integrase